MTYQMALLESKLEGEEKGRLQGIESVAFNMIKKGMALETISELTELSIAHLKSLADKLKISHVPNK